MARALSSRSARFGHVVAACARYGAANEGSELSSQSELRLARIAAMAALVAALSVAGCGRKAGLDPPPGATAADTSVSRPDLEPVIGPGDAPDFVEVGEAGIAVDHAMRR